MRKSLEVHTSSKSAEHYTPPAIVKAVVQVFGVIDLDPCADPGKLIPALRHYTKADDGLSQFWNSAIYLNPCDYAIIDVCQNISNVPTVTNPSPQRWNTSGHEPQSLTGLRPGVESVSRRAAENESERVESESGQLPLKSNAPTVTSSSQQRRNTLYHEPQSLTALRPGVESVLGPHQESAESMHAELLAPLLDAPQENWPKLRAVLASVPNAESLTLLQTYTFLATLAVEPDLVRGAEIALVTMLGLNKRSDALTLWSEIKSWLKKSVIANLSKAESENAFNPKPTTISAASDTCLSLGSGRQPIGKPVKKRGITNVPTVEQSENSPKITLYPSPTSNVPAQFGQTSFLPAIGATAQNNTNPPMNGAKVPMFSKESLTIFQHYPNLIEVFYPSTVYLNPPYGTEIGPWIAKLREELWAGRVSEAIALVPARTDTEWWERLTDEPSPTVCFVKGRLRFGNATNSAPFPSAIAYFGLDDAKFCEVFRQFGRIWQCKQHPTANASLLSPTLMAHWQASESPSILPFFAA